MNPLKEFTKKEKILWLASLLLVAGANLLSILAGHASLLHLAAALIAVFFINDSYGFYCWKKREKKQGVNTNE